MSVEPAAGHSPVPLCWIETDPVDLVRGLRKLARMPKPPLAGRIVFFYLDGDMLVIHVGASSVHMQAAGEWPMAAVLLYRTLDVLVSLAASSAADRPLRMEGLQDRVRIGGASFTCRFEDKGIPLALVSEAEQERQRAKRDREGARHQEQRDNEEARQLGKPVPKGIPIQKLLLQEEKGEQAQAIDPDGRYPVAGLRQVDRVAWVVHRLIPGAHVARTRDVYQFTLPDPGGVVVIVTPEEVQCRLPSVNWTSGYAGPVDTSILWQSLRIDLVDPSQKKLLRLIGSTVQRRKDQTRPCALCGEPTPPECADVVDRAYVCHGCAEGRMGIVH
jgi:hypothetical protein